MSDTLIAPASADTTVVDSQVVATSPASTEPVSGNPAAEEARRALYEKHYGTSSGTADIPSGTSTSASVAQADQTSSTTPPASAVPPEMIEVLQAMQRELVDLRTKVGQPMQAAPVVATTAAEPDWISLLREGKVDEAKRALVLDVAKELQGPTVEQAVSRAREVARAESEAAAFVAEIRTANADIIEMEPYVTMQAQAALAQVTAEGKIKTTEDAIREYKKAVLDATRSAREVALKFRGSGKAEANVRNREVLASSTIPPQQVDQARTQQTTDAEKAPESVESYFEKRKAQENSRRGLAV